MQNHLITKKGGGARGGRIIRSIVLIIFTILLEISPAYAQVIPPVPTYDPYSPTTTPLPTNTPFYGPTIAPPFWDITPTPAYLGDCPDYPRDPERELTFQYLSKCSQCVINNPVIPTLQGGIQAFELEYATTPPVPSPSPTANLGDPLFDSDIVRASLMWNYAEFTNDVQWDFLYEFEGYYSYGDFRDVTAELWYPDENVNYPHKYNFWTNAHISSGITIHGSSTFSGYNASGTYRIKNKECQDGLEIWNLDNNELITDLAEGFEYAFPYFYVDQGTTTSHVFNGNWDLYCKGKQDKLIDAYSIKFVKATLLRPVTIETDFMMGLGRYSQEPPPDVGYCSEWEYQDEQEPQPPIFTLPDIDVWQGACMQIIPAFSWYRDSSGSYLFDINLSFPGFAICPVWVNFTPLEIAGIGIPFEIMFLPALTWVLDAILKL